MDILSNKAGLPRHPMQLRQGKLKKMDYSDLARLASGHVEARIVQTAIELRLFDCIGDRALPAAEIAAALATDPRATELLLNSLAALALLDKRDKRFSLSEAARTYLVVQSPRSLSGMIFFDASLWRYWEQLAVAVRSGRPVCEPNMYQDNAAATETFINGMDSLVKARGDAEVVAAALDWRDVADLLDVGSGPATYPITLCRKFPGMRVTVFDLPGTLRITERYVRRAALTERINLVSGDYRSDAIPGCYEAIFLSNIIHGENFDENRRLIAKLVSNLKTGGRIIVKDHILDETRAQPTVGAVFSLLMLLTTNDGRCYGFDEVKSWMENAGLTGIEQIHLPPPLTSSLVVGTR